MREVNGVYTQRLNKAGMVYAQEAYILYHQLLFFRSPFGPLLWIIIPKKRALKNHPVEFTLI